MHQAIIVCCFSLMDAYTRPRRILTPSLKSILRVQRLRRPVSGDVANRVAMMTERIRRGNVYTRGQEDICFTAFAPSGAATDGSTPPPNVADPGGTTLSVVVDKRGCPGRYLGRRPMVWLYGG